MGLEVSEMGKVQALVAKELVVVRQALLVQVQDIRQLQELEAKVLGGVCLLLAV